MSLTDSEAMQQGRGSTGTGGVVVRREGGAHGARLPWTRIDLFVGDDVDA